MHLTNIGLERQQHTITTTTWVTTTTTTTGICYCSLTAGSQAAPCTSYFTAGRYMVMHTGLAALWPPSLLVLVAGVVRGHVAGPAPQMPERQSGQLVLM